jgi:RNA polymerase sigma factor (TIGR02999 family)
MRDVTQILDALREGQTQASEKLIPLVYDELRRLAEYQLAREKPGQTLQATALVHEAYLRLVSQSHDRWENRRHFFGAAAQAMRRIIVENARRKRRLVHGGTLQRVDREVAEIAAAVPSEDVLALDEALEEFARKEPQAAELVHLRFFVGLTQEQAAELLGISRRTVNSMWVFARAWLYRALHPEPGP